MFENVPSRTAGSRVPDAGPSSMRSPQGPHVVDDPYAHLWILRPLARAAAIAYEGAGPDLGRYTDWATDGLPQFSPRPSSP